MWYDVGMWHVSAACRNSRTLGVRYDVRKQAGHECIEEQSCSTSLWIKTLQHAILRSTVSGIGAALTSAGQLLTTCSRQRLTTLNAP